MIRIIFYNNGIEVKGHANVVTCSEVSILVWAYGNTIADIDDSARYYTSAVHGKNNGYTCLTCDADNEKAKWLLEQCIYNAKLWGKDLWDPDEVQIEETDWELVFPFSDEVWRKGRVNE